MPRTLRFLLFKVFRSLNLSQYCTSPAELAALPEDTKRELRTLLVNALRKELAALLADDKEEASEGTLFLLFLVTPVPETQLATPTEMMEWVGLAAVYERDGLEYVLGCLRNRVQSMVSRSQRESEYAQDIEEKTSVLSQLEALGDWQTLTPTERRYMQEAAKAKSRAALAKQWGLTVGGTKDRLNRIRKKIKKISKK